MLIINALLAAWCLSVVLVVRPLPPTIRALNLIAGLLNLYMVVR